MSARRVLIISLTFGLLWVCAERPGRADDWLAGRGWRLDKNSAANATLVSTADGLSVELKSTPQSPLLIRCDASAAIPADAKRLTLWVDPAVMGNAFPWKVLTGSVHARVRDARGDLYRFPFCLGSLTNRGWGRLATEDLSLCPYQRPGTKTPQKPLVLTGLDIKVGTTGVKRIRLHGLAADTEAHILPARPWEIVSLTDPADRQSGYAWTGSGIEYDAEDWHGLPYLPLDALTDRPGEYIVGIRMRQGWQGPVQRQWSQKVVLPPTGLGEEKRRPLFLPPPQPGVYFLEARIWDKGYTLQAIRYFLLLAPDVKGPQPAGAGIVEGPGGFLALRKGDGNLFSCQVKMPPLPGEKSVHVSLTDYPFNVLKEETLTIPATASDVWEARVEFPAQAQEACRAFVELRVAGKVADKDGLILGQKGVRSLFSASEINPVPFVCNGATASAFLVNAVPPAGLDVLARVGRGMDQAALNGNQVVEIEIPWQDLEPLPGLLQFSLLDKILDLAGKKGLKVKIAPWYLGDHAPRWLFPYYACYEDGGSTFIGGSHFAPSASNPIVQQGVVRLWKAIAERYRRHPAFAGYLIVGPSLDLGYWHNGLLHQTDYSPTAVAAFQHYLKDVRHDSLPEISNRYGQNFLTWEDIWPPQKNWEKEVDLRPQWVDFCSYQQWELYQWMERIFQAIRQEDPVHAMTQYQYCSYGPQEYYYPLFQKYRVEATTGGTEAADYQRFVSIYHLWGLRSRGGETIQTVDKWNLYRSLFNMLAYGGDGSYYAVQWHNVFPEPWDTEPDGALHLQRWSAAKGIGGWLARVKGINFSPDFANGSKMIKELGDASPMPSEAGCLSSYANCLYKMRSLLPYFVSGPAVTKAWMEKEHRLPLWISDTTPLELFRNLKLLVADSDIPVMSRSTAEGLAAYVKAGGCLVTFAATGRYTVETGRPDFGFLAALGFSAPVALPEKKESFAAQGFSFLKGENLVFSDMYSVQAPAGTEVLASLPDGPPCALRRNLGAGEIVLFLGQLDWERSGRILGALCRRRNVPQWCDATDARIQVYALQRDETRYILAYYYLDRRQNDLGGKQPVQANVKVYGLAAPEYSVTEVGAERRLGEFTSKQLEAGLDIGFQMGELKVLKCSPVGAR